MNLSEQEFSKEKQLLIQHFGINLNFDYYNGELGARTGFKEIIDALNVFPVPDGDTGTNMSMSINNAKKELAEIKETNLAIERASIIMQDLEKFSTEAGEKRVLNAKEDFAKGEGYIFGDA